MDISGIISITGKPGLYKVISQTKNGLLVESIDDGKRYPVFASEKVSSLEDISLYTKGDDMPLKEVFEKIYEKTGGKEAVNAKSEPNELRNYLASVVDYDQERVYNSDVKKLLQWFNTLVSKGLLDKKEEPTAESSEETKAVKDLVKKESNKKTAVKKTSDNAKIKTSTAKKGGSVKSVTPRKAG
ncbi:MAG: DUF5606 domain-containing protein [Flavobacteriales bacterium]|nr:DUF5606 domain-containing protein [Flavobacteriales bacterium]